jgi:GTP-binding protein EngB required for normal cell division
MAATGPKELLSVLGDVKARVQDKLGIVDFPMPQFILLGKQSVGKSRLIEALAGETFNFVSGTLGSRRPTVLQFSNVAGAGASKWFVRDVATNQWIEHTVAEVMVKIGNAHEELGESVSRDPCWVRIESPSCVDMQIVDLPGFRDFSIDDSKKALSSQIEELNQGFMSEAKNVMLCVEQCGDASTMSTLAKCRDLDPMFKRTILIRNKLDKYYSDLEPSNINQWVAGFGDLPETLVRFALTLPFWQEGQPPPKPFVQLREEKCEEDVRVLQSKGIEAKYLATIGFKAFAGYMEKKIEMLFNDSIQPVMDNLKDLKLTNNQKAESLKNEYEETDPTIISNTTRSCGESFAGALNMVMEGSLNVTVGRMDLPTELRKFAEHHQTSGTTESMQLLPSDDFAGLDDYIDYLTTEIQLGAWNAEVNGGAQFRRVMGEVEIFLRFSEIAVETKKRDVIQARGVNMSTLTWRDVVVKLLGNEAHLPLQRRVRYVGERLRWFFEIQKEVVIDFMSSLEGAPGAKMFSPMYVKHVKFIKQNPMIKHLIFTAYDTAVERQLNQFLALFSNMLTSTFSNPWVNLKGNTIEMAASEEEEEDFKMRIPKEIESRAGMETTLNTWLQDIPTDATNIDEAVDKVQMLVLKTYGYIRSQVCDQVELFTESFFKLPMLRRLNEDMANIKIDKENQTKYMQRRESLGQQLKDTQTNVTEVEWCIDRLVTYKMKCDASRR